MEAALGQVNSLNAKIREIQSMQKEANYLDIPGKMAKIEEMERQLRNIQLMLKKVEKLENFELEMDEAKSKIHELENSVKNLKGGRIGSTNPAGNWMPNARQKENQVPNIQNANIPNGNSQNLQRNSKNNNSTPFGNNNNNNNNNNGPFGNEDRGNFSDRLNPYKWGNSK
jgi:hypothetical protein